MKDPHGGGPPFPIIPGHEFSRVIVALGAGVTEWAKGDFVYGLNDWFEDGAQAEYCIAPAAPLAPKPRSLDHVQAAGVPISAPTAWQALFARARLRAGQRVLIHGAAGVI
jgi:NADPH:quinone reductase-like Zn-dependent oxidoreductase